MDNETKLKWDRIKGGQLKGTYNNCLNFLMSSGIYKIKFNEFSNEIEVNGDRLEDMHLIQIKEKMRDISLEPSISYIDEAVKTIAFKNRYHPVKEWIIGLKWDGNERCDWWLSFYCGAESSDYVRFVSRTIILACVNRVFRPGCQYDYMPILEGHQGLGKSSIIRALGGEWYKEVSLIERDRDTVQKLQGAMMVEVAELAAFGKRDIDSLKAFITHPADFARFAYARNDKKYPRQSTFIGTVNPDAAGYLNDPTGNRRFLPVAIKKADLISIINDRNQLFAEAYQLYLKGTKIYLDDKILLDQAVEQQELRESDDPWCEYLMDWIERYPNKIELENITCLDVFVKALDGKKDGCNRSVSVRISNVLKKIGYKPSKPKRVDGRLGRFWDLTNKVSL